MSLKIRQNFFPSLAVSIHPSDIYTACHHIASHSCDDYTKRYSYYGFGKMQKIYLTVTKRDFVKLTKKFALCFSNFCRLMLEIHNTSCLRINNINEAMILHENTSRNYTINVFISGFIFEKIEFENSISIIICEFG